VLSVTSCAGIGLAMNPIALGNMTLSAGSLNSDALAQGFKEVRALAFLVFANLLSHSVRSDCNSSRKVRSSSIRSSVGWLGIKKDSDLPLCLGSIYPSTALSQRPRPLALRLMALTCRVVAVAANRYFPESGTERADTASTVARQ
jgi:hypothetical protein